jgi:hydroxyacylglutathione hydrolase
LNPACTIQTILCGEDNYLYLLIDRNKQAVVIDPGEAEPVISVAEKQTLKLTHILLTHHHADHTGGIETLKAKYSCRAIGPDSQRIAGLDEIVHDNQILSFPDFSIRVICTPGHTRTSVCYILQSRVCSRAAHPTEAAEKPDAVFTGDTLFVCGCGRCFEGSPQQMHASLMKLAALPDATLVYPGHDYTIDNYQFALTVEPDNEVVKKRLLELEANGSMSAIPSNIGLEKQTNPFLRTQSHSIRKTLNMPDAPDWEVFGYLRNKKNLF